MKAKYCFATIRVVIILLVLLGSLLISVDGQNQTRNVIPLAGIAYSYDIVVTTTSDLADFGGAQMIGDLPGPDGVTSLREALIAANNSGGHKVIGFNIPLSDTGFTESVFVIKPGSRLPNLRTDSITIDGTSQTDFTGDTNPYGPEIVLDGSLAGNSEGITIQPSNGHNIRGLVIHSFGQAGIQFYANNPTGEPNDVKITKCYIGTDETGAVAKGNGWEGIAINGNRHVIGGPDPEDANLISGNHLSEIGVEGQNTIIQGNFIGTDRTGQIALGQSAGIMLGNSRGGVVKDNLISGCSDWGIVLLNFSENNLIENNMIGTDISGGNPLPNGTGIQIVNAVKNTIAGNIIAFSIGHGIEVLQDSYGNQITRNSIFSNGFLGIALGTGGVTPNDPGDKDTGPNNLMNFPEITSAKTTPRSLVVNGTIDTPNPKKVTIEIFANPDPNPGKDPSGFGEGATYLGSIKPKSDGKFTAYLPYVPPGTWITATATDANGNTSEFSKAVEAQ